MFTDSRSKRVVLLAHCVLNQNAKIDQCAHYPGVIPEIVDLLVRSGIGIIQMPCPEMHCLGLDRQADRSKAATVASEDTRVACRMRDASAVAICREFAADLVYQVQEYRKNGFEVVGILSINGSPTCGVEANWFQDREKPGPGVFITELQKQLQRAGIHLPFRGIKAKEMQRTVAVMQQLIGS